MPEALITAALRRAFWAQPPTAGLVVHSDPGGQYCANAVTLRLAWPLDEVHRKMLTAFVVGAASQTTINRPDLQASLALEIANGEKYHAVARQGAVSVEAGRLSHPNRGDFFAIAFLWHAR